jgi:AcrR family transcriptional regulator
METKVTDRLEPADWIAEALLVLAERGIDAVRIEPLATRLKVTRGSFYWHFRDRDALLTAMVDTWEAQETDGVIARIKALGGTPRFRLDRLLDYCVTEDWRLEAELRVWALRDPVIAARVAAVDLRRTDYLATLFYRINGSETDAPLLAAHLYAWWVGQFQVGSVVPDIDRRAAASHFLDRLLGDLA